MATREGIERREDGGIVLRELGVFGGGALGGALVEAVDFGLVGGSRLQRREERSGNGRETSRRLVEDETV